ncbi:MAG: glycerate kinase [Ardenticatenia bacterium]|nr:MAG: glycerate kinase [Ardenticatenia bacterium]
MMDARTLLPHLITAALDAVEPRRAVHRVLHRDENRLTVGAQTYTIEAPTRLFVVGMGKAAARMALAVHEKAGDLITDGLVITKYGHATAPAIGRIRVREAAHPVPDEAGVAATNAMLSLLADTRPDDLVLVLVSGGGSALLVAPAPGLRLADLQQTTDLLLASGATIHELNTVRKHLSAVKGGQLARHAAPAHVETLIISDVVGDDLDVIASGPTVPDPTTFADAKAVLERYGLWERVPPAVRHHLNAGCAGHLPETPKPGDPVFERVRNYLIARNADAAQAAAEEAERAGWHAQVLTTFLQGEAREVGRVVAALGQQIARYDTPLPTPACLILGGETTVTVRGNGIGGRNQELALAAALAIEGWERLLIATFATDGGDGPTEAAGGVVDGATTQAIRTAGIDPRRALDNNDSYHALHAAHALIVTGPTGTNVTDLVFVLVDRLPTQKRPH